MNLSNKCHLLTVLGVLVLKW